MLSNALAKVRSFDWLLFLPVSFLVLLSLAELYSVGLGQAAGDLSFFNRQLIFTLIGLGLLIFLANRDYYFLYSYSNLIYFLGVLSLIAVLLFGATVNGTKGWFNLFGFGIQPVEFVKYVLVIFLARYLAGASSHANPLRNLMVTGLATGLLVLLVMLQPDFGSASLLVFIWLLSLFVSGLPKRFFLIILGSLLVTAVIAWQFFLADYQKERVLNFVRPSSELSSNYNINQAMIAIGAGGLSGRGLGFGSQSQLKFLPEAKTDFIFAVISEELGLIGVILVLALFSLFFWRLFKNLANIKNDFSSFLVILSGGLIFIEMFINIGMNLGLVPVVGIALPFLSYGGSSLIINLAMVGALQSVVARSKLKQY
jgi:rod shape determining protein RodA